MAMRGLVERAGGASLRGKMMALTALVSALVVGLLFVSLSLDLRGLSRRSLSRTLEQHQRMLVGLQRQSLADLLRASTLMSENPTLLASMETYRVESRADGAERGDLLATIQLEVEKIARGLGRDLLVVTDPGGRVLARSGSGELPTLGDGLLDRVLVKEALNQEAPVGARNFSVLRFHGQIFQVGCVPIDLGGEVVGALILGDRIDDRFIARWQETFSSQIAITAGGELIGSTLPPDAGLAMQLDDPRRSAPLEVEGEEFIAAAAVLGLDEQGRPVTLHILQSLTAAMAGSNRALLTTLLGYGTLLVLLTGLAASLVSRSVLRPLDRLVRFMGASGDQGVSGERFEAPGAGAEVRALAASFNRLMESLQRHEDRLVAKAREDLAHLERLKESEKLAALGRMLSGAAHEINNPMTGVIGNIDLLLQRDGLQPEVRERLEQVRKEGHRIVALTRNLLKVARRGGGQRTTVDLGNLIRETAGLRRRDFEREGIGLELRFPDRPVMLTASELELQQVVLNIVNNAFDALKGRPGQPALTITLSCEETEVVVTCHDNGPGLADPSQVFDHFYTTKPVGQGTGLGLGISQAIVEGHGGRILADNRPEGGARFTIRLPASAAAAAAPVPVVEPLRRAAPARPSLPASILVVDDEPVVLELQMAILDSLGARAVAAQTGADAIELLRNRDFDLIVSDLAIGGAVSGKDLYAWAVAHGRREGAGFVFLVSDVGQEAGFVSEARSRSLRKPFAMDEYVALLREAWNEKHAAA